MIYKAPKMNVLDGKQPLLLLWSGDGISVWMVPGMVSIAKHATTDAHHFPHSIFSSS